MILLLSFLLLFTLFVLTASSSSENIANKNISFIDEKFIERTLERCISNSEKMGPQLLIGTKTDYLEALFQYILKKSIEIIERNRIISENERKVFIKKIFAVSNELIFLNANDLKNISCAEKSIGSMLKALEVLDPYLNTDDGLNAVLKFAEFSFLNDSQDLIFSLILRHLNDPQKNFQYLR